MATSNINNELKALAPHFCIFICIGLYQTLSNQMPSNSVVSVHKMTLFLDAPNQHTFLVEYRGEGGSGNDAGCSNVDQMSECSTTWNCKCQDSSNNTYACVRTVSNPGNTIFCTFEDDVGFEEMYNIEQVRTMTSQGSRHTTTFHSFLSQYCIQKCLV